MSKIASSALLAAAVVMRVLAPVQRPLQDCRAEDEGHGVIPEAVKVF